MNAPSRRLKTQPLPSVTAQNFHAERIYRRPTDRIVRWMEQRAPDRYLLDPDVLADVGRDAVDKTPLHAFDTPEDARQARFQHVIDALHARYGDRIDIEPEWIINRCGGAEFVAATLHASPFEFLFICGTNMNVHGADSGTYPCDVFDFVLEGNNRNTGTGPYEPVEETRAGEYTYLGAGEQKIWSMDGPCWMIDYARGFMPFMVPHGLAENFTVLANPVGTLRNGRSVGRRVLHDVVRHRIPAYFGRV